MVLKVIAPFRDKYDRTTRYQPGDVLETDDAERARDLIERRLCEERPEPTQEPTEEPTEEPEPTTTAKRKPAKGKQKTK